MTLPSNKFGVTFLNLTSILFVAVGIFSICGGVFNWEWFMNNRKAQLWVSLIGRGPTRIFYIILGLVLSTLGVLMGLGIVK